jgi:DNA-binding response OmpR family regulator
LLTGLNTDAHVVRGFRAGADDYVTKPFSPRQLAARIRAIIGRHARSAGGGSYLTGPEPARELRIGDLVIDADSHEVRWEGNHVQLTRTEFRLLHLLAMNVGRVVSGSRLVEYAWGYDEDDTSLLKTHISHIRTKLGLTRSGPARIASVARVGYKLVLPTSEGAPADEPDSADEGDLDNDDEDAPLRGAGSSSAA